MKKTTVWICSNCGKQSSNYLGYCPQCKQYETFENQILDNQNKKTIEQRNDRISSETQQLINIKSNSINRIITNIHEFDRVVGGGIVSDSVNVLTAIPGAGKSTLLLIIANNIALQGLKVLYISGEESESQIKMRADRILNKISDNIYIRSETNIDLILSEILKIKPAFLIIDSIQMMYSNNIDGVINGEKQLIYSSSLILKAAKNSKEKMAVFLVSQMTKDDEIRGSREFEHMVDAVFTLNIENESGILRTLRSTKNRFGDVSDVGLFEMSENGLNEITDPNKYFITPRITPVCGSVISTIKEGNRTIALEINTLLEDNSYSYPTRICQGINKDFLQIILAVISNKLTSIIRKKDVYIQTSNGINIKETCVGLAIAASIYSFIKKIPIANDTVFVGEISLTGEIKRVPNIDQIIDDLDRMGFKNIYIPKFNINRKHPGKINIHELSKIEELRKIII